MLRSLLFILVFGHITNGLPAKNVSPCNIEACHQTNPKKLNIHMIPHSHDDVGWLKTVDEYYYGTKRDTHFAGVQYIIGSVVDALQGNADRRFIQVETAFLSKWWKKQSERTKEVVQKLINNGQLEIINGAWSMNDEAVTHYQSIIDQFSWGLKTINDTLGECARPKIGWQIDPFGHSNEMATIFAQLGYEAIFFSRLDYRDQKERLRTKSMEMIWHGSESLGSSSRSQIFTSIINDSYSTPQEFCYDVLCSTSTQPINDDEESPGYNLVAKAKRFVEEVKRRSVHYITPNLLFPLGGDFTYQDAHMYYINIEKLMAGVNMLYPDINVFYSTPSCYVKAVHEMSTAKKMSFPVKYDDFLPYASEPHSYWSGYYTSRPNSKRLERVGNNLLQVTKQLVSFERIISQDYSKNLTLLREAMGIMQHHDAITGTEKQGVAMDYARLITKAMKASEAKVSEIIFDLLKKKGANIDKMSVRFESCLLANVSHCVASNKKAFTVAVYNPLSRPVSHYVRLPVNASAFQITGPNNQKLSYDVVPNRRSFQYVHDIQPSVNDLVFLAKNIPAHGLQYFYVVTRNAAKEEREPPFNPNYFGTSQIGFYIDPDTGLLSNIRLNDTMLPVKQEILFYISANRTNIRPLKRASGAYIFRPNNSIALPFTTKNLKIQQFRGIHVDELYQTFNGYISQIIRVYKNENHIEFDWMVGPLNRADSKNNGMEVISRFTTNLQTANVFYTDSNGREMIKRTLNSRDTFNYTNEEETAGNYYPIASKIVIKDTKQNIEFAVLNDRAQGGSSLKSGAIELMLHRRLVQDDAYGVDEVLSEEEFRQGVVAKGTHYITFGSTNSSEKTSANIQRDLAHKKLLSPWIFVADSTQVSLKETQDKLNFEFAALQKLVPENVNILTLEPWDEDTYLLRLEHMFQVNEDPKMSKPAAVNLNGLFTFFEITQIRETTLGGNQWLEENVKMKWYQGNAVPEAYSQVSKVDALEITLNSMEIRTFIIKVLKKTEKASSGFHPYPSIVIIVLCFLFKIIF